MKWILLMVAVGLANGTSGSVGPEPPARTSEEMVCNPRTTFKIKCNTCFCSPTGMNYGCTKMGCIDINQFDRPEYEANEIQSYRKRGAEFRNIRKKRAAADIYADDDPQFFVDEDPAPLSFEQQKELARQNYLQQQQAYYDQLQHQQEMAEEKEMLGQQQEDMQSQLEYQQEQDAIQREDDARQQALDRQQMLLEQQQERKQNEQYHRKVRNFPRKSSFKNMFSQ